MFGCSNTLGSACSSALTDDDFTHDGVNYEITSVLVEGAGREAFSVERALGLVACVVPAEATTEGGAWRLRIAPDNPEPEDTE